MLMMSLFGVVIVVVLRYLLLNVWYMCMWFCKVLMWKFFLCVSTVSALENIDCSVLFCILFVYVYVYFVFNILYDDFKILFILCVMCVSVLYNESGLLFERVSLSRSMDSRGGCASRKNILLLVCIWLWCIESV